MSDFEGSPAQLKDKSGQPTGEWGAWINGLAHITQAQLRQWKEEQVGRTVTVRTRKGEEHEEVIAEVLFVRFPNPGEEDECSALVRFGGAAQKPTGGNRSELAQALLKEMKALRKDIREHRTLLASKRTPGPSTNPDDDLPF